MRMCGKKVMAASMKTCVCFVKQKILSETLFQYKLLKSNYHNRCLLSGRHSFVWMCQLKHSTAANTEYIRLQWAVAPWENLPYEKQLERKQAFAKDSMKRVANMLTSNQAGSPTTELMDYLASCGGHACNVGQIRPSPVTEGYRNKSRFVVGPGLDGQPRVGFYLKPEWSKLDSYVPVSNGPLRTQHTLHKDIAEAFEAYVRRSDIPAVGMRYAWGVAWKSLLVRSNSEGHVMVSVQVNPDQSSEAKLGRIREEVKDFFCHGPGKPFSVTSLFFQQCRHKSCTHQTAPFELLDGTPYMFEHLLGCTFRISPDAFFQINRSATEVLYNTVAELGQFQPNTTLLDVCCGTGTIGVLMSKLVKRVLGIEIIASAVDDATLNAKLNGVTNAEFVCGRAAKYFKRLTPEFSSKDDVIAILNPSRNGVGKRLITAVRACTAINRVIYMSCKPKGRAAFDFYRLCQEEDKKSELTGRPFVLKEAIPVDLFPHTRHYELVMLFER